MTSLPIPGQDPWDQDLNAYLADLDNRVDALEADTPQVVRQVQAGPITLPAASNWTSLPTPFIMNINPTVRSNVLVSFSAYIDTNVNANEVKFAGEVSGANTSPAGQPPEHTLRVGGKQEVDMTVNLTYVVTFDPGATTIEIKYTAALAGATYESLRVSLIELGAA